MISIARSRLCLGALVFFSTQIFPVQSIRAADSEKDPASPLAQTYYLLHNTAHQDSMVAMIFVVKTASPAATKLVKAIAHFNGRLSNQLDEYADQMRIDLDRNPLPTAEIKVRERISDMKQHDLLAVSGAAFTLQLLLTQFEALGYERQLSAQAADLETSSTRREYLKETSRQLQEFRTKVIALLASGG